jgi:F-type H+-transporting ATPase subunit a
MAAFVSHKISLTPKGLTGAVEAVFEMLLHLIESVCGDRQKAKKFFPLLMTIFLFIIVNNWLGLLPGFGSILLKHGQESTPLLRAGTADLNTTLALASIAVLMIQYYGIKHLGIKSFSKRYFNFANPVLFFVGLLELISEISKAISFSFRLFGNIFAGEVLLLVIAILAPFLAPIPFFGLEIFVGFIQALVFTVLTLVFLTIATAEDSSH